MTTESADLTAAELVDADRRVPDVGQFAGGVASDERHAALRAWVRRLGELLGEALTRHEGAELLALVEQVRALARRPDDGDELHALL
jgi:phosphoenolpyruvate carboxylase